LVGDDSADDVDDCMHDRSVLSSNRPMAMRSDAALVAVAMARSDSATGPGHPGAAHRLSRRAFAAAIVIAAGVALSTLRTEGMNQMTATPRAHASGEFTVGGELTSTGWAPGPCG